jgi:hypothetical protein
MKFYREKEYNNYYFWQIKRNKLNAIYFNYTIAFYKKGSLHNYKNFAYITNTSYKQFCLNGSCYGHGNAFNKLSWRRFVKLQAFL